MNDDDRDLLLSKLIAQPRDRDSLLTEAGVGPTERAELMSLTDVSDSLWLNAQAAPPLADDPVAAMLGLIPDRECSLDARALTQARKRAGLKVSEVAGRLRARGWPAQEADVFRWENRSAADVSPAVIQAIAEILQTSVDNLILKPGVNLGAESLFMSIKEHPLFEELVNRWARARNVPRAVAAAALESRMIATVHRGATPDAEQLLSSLDMLVASIERPEAR